MRKKVNRFEPGISGGDRFQLRDPIGLGIDDRPVAVGRQGRAQGLHIGEAAVDHEEVANSHWKPSDVERDRFA